MKVRILLIIGIILLTGGIIFFIINNNYDPYSVPEEVIISLNDNKFEVYEKHTSDELVSSINADIVSKEIELKNDTLGEYIYNLEYMYKKRKYKYDIVYEIVDTIPPVFISAPKTLTMEYNDNEDVCDKIVYADIYDSIPSCHINGEYDKSSIGTYNNLEYVVVDSSNNEVKKSFNLNVVSKISTSNSYTTPKYLYIDDIIRKYKNDSTSIGIDVSKWQGNVNFEAVRDSGIEFVIMRIGSQRKPEDELDMDVRFQEYYKKAREAGLKIGVYVYNTSISEEDGRKTAKWVMDKLNGDKLDFPIAYDWEDWTDLTKFKISLHTLSEAYRAFKSELEKNGYEAMLYSSKFYLENAWVNYEDSKIWLAHYTDKTDYKGEYMMWQMTSLAKVNGITENTVDVDILYKERSD